MSANPESSDSTQDAVVVPPEALAFLAENPTGVDYLSLDKNGDIVLPTKFRIQIPGVDHDFGRCTLAKNPKVTYDETHEVLDAEGNVIRTGEYVFEVIPYRKRSLHVGTYEDVDQPTMTKVVKDIFKNENRIMVVASYATPIPRCATLPFRIDEIHYDIGLRKSSERRTGKVKPAVKVKRGTLNADSGDLDNGSHVGWVATGEVFRMGNPTPEIVIPESPQRADHMAAFADMFYDEAPTEAQVEDFLASLD
jgi:hypothetical protein